ncbi:MAG: acyl--CoA ligase [Spirochaetales bacterium]|nr:acyl--CoA ligase [Spirochaetales bacterium]
MSFVIENVFDKYTDPETLSRIVDYPNMTQMWRNCCARYTDNPAIDDGRPYSFSELDRLASGVRGALAAAGIGRGAKVGIFMPNSVQFVYSFIGCTTLGAVAVLIPPQLDDATLFGFSMKYGLDALLTVDAMMGKTGVLAAKRPGFRIIDAGKAEGQTAPDCDVDTDAPCAVMFTGGTTGRSKGVVLSHRAVMRGTKNGCYGYKEVFNQRYFIVLPMTHVFGLIRNTLTSLYTGSCLHICHDNTQMFREIAMFRPTILVLVPALAEMALNISRQFGKNMLGPDCKYIICGAAAVAPFLVKEWHKLGVTLFPGYGLTESANLVSGNPDCLEHPDSVGYIYSGMEVKVVDGELWLRGVNMLDGYASEPEEDQKAFSDGWFRTGDLVRFDDDGRLYITGRIKEIIVLSNGENISPAELETRFTEIDCIQDALVYSKIEDGREYLVLEVLPRPAVIAAVPENVREIFIKDEINKVNSALPSYKQINRIVIRTADFKRSPSMKILRKQD